MTICLITVVTNDLMSINFRLAANEPKQFNITAGLYSAPFPLGYYRTGCTHSS